MKLNKMLDTQKKYDYRFEQCQKIVSDLESMGVFKEWSLLPREDCARVATFDEIKNLRYWNLIQKEDCFIESSDLGVVFSAFVEIEGDCGDKYRVILLPNRTFLVEYFNDVDDSMNYEQLNTLQDVYGKIISKIQANPRRSKA